MDAIRLVRAANPGPMTLDGTNTWLIPDGRRWVVVDPGPLLDEHLDALVAATDGQVSRVLLTHAHLDHAEGADAFAQRVDATVFASPASADRLREFDIDVLGDEMELALENGTLTVLHTPGHTGDSTSFLARIGDEAGLLTGDTVLGRGTTVLMPPDGTLADYLDSLERLEWIASRLGHEGIPIALLPGHGPAHADGLSVITYYIDHRRERLDQVRTHLAEGVTDPLELVERIYSDVPDAVKGAALMSVQAQLEFLRGRG
jgi:glyoxylase-like metal-dependent hydrolase (beta-lactamase superfamily II)